MDDGRIIPNGMLTLDPPKPMSYAYCGDTRFKPDIVDQIKGVGILYHEATFLETEKHLSAKTKHATAKEAATIARMANVGKLILGHYSTRYRSINSFKEEAEEIFENVELADDGKVFEF